jgi:hypothetical protein
MPSKTKAARKQVYLSPDFTLNSRLAYLSTLKIEAKCSSETSVDFQRTTRRYILGDRTVHNQRVNAVWGDNRLLSENHTNNYPGRGGSDQ